MQGAYLFVVVSIYYFVPLWPTPASELGPLVLHENTHEKIVSALAGAVNPLDHPILY